MNSSLLKSFSYTIILLSTLMAHSSSKKNQCKRSFSTKLPSYIKQANDILKLAMAHDMFKMIPEKQRFEKLTLDIINDRQFIIAINKKKKEDREKAWTEIKDSIEYIMTEKFIQTKVLESEKLTAQFIDNLKLKMQFIDNSKRQPNQNVIPAGLEFIKNQTGVELERTITRFIDESGLPNEEMEYFKKSLEDFFQTVDKDTFKLSDYKQPRTEFMEFYIDNPLFREWIYKLKILTDLQKQLDTPLAKLKKLEQTLMDEKTLPFPFELFSSKISDFPNWRKDIIIALQKTLPTKNVIKLY